MFNNQTSNNNDASEMINIKKFNYHNYNDDDDDDDVLNCNSRTCKSISSSSSMFKHPWRTSFCLMIQVFILIDIINRLLIDLSNQLKIMKNDDDDYNFYYQHQQQQQQQQLMVMFGVMMANAQQIKCGDIKQCSKMFRDATLSHNLSYDLSNDKIERICVKLNRAVQCFNNYRKMCIDDNFQHTKMTADFYDQMSEGPLGLTMELCNNAKFKQDYLTLGPCQKKYRNEFDRCLTMNQGNQILQNGSNSTILEQFIEHCCALHNYHNCIYDISLDKCGKDAAEFSLKILELFNRGYLRECAKYANLSHLCIRDRFLRSNGNKLLILWDYCYLLSLSLSLSLSFSLLLFIMFIY